MPSRYIDADIWSDEWFSELGFFEQALWIGLFSKCADNQGRMRDNAALIRSAVFPTKDVPLADIDAFLTKAAAEWRVYRYQDDGRPYLQLVRWWDHQCPRFATASSFPAPTGWEDHVCATIKGSKALVNWYNPGEHAAKARAWVDQQRRTSQALDSEKQDCSVQSAVQSAVQNTTTDSRTSAKTRTRTQTPDPDIDPDKDPDPSTGAGELSSSFSAQAFTAFESVIGLVSGAMQRDEIISYLAELEQRHIESWWESALQVAADQNKHSWAYVRGILRNCLDEGRPPHGRGSPGKKQDEKRTITIIDPHTGQSRVVEAAI